MASRVAPPRHPASTGARTPVLASPAFRHAPQEAPPLPPEPRKKAPHSSGSVFLFVTGGSLSWAFQPGPLIRATLSALILHHHLLYNFNLSPLDLSLQSTILPDACYCSSKTIASCCKTRPSLCVTSPPGDSSSLFFAVGATGSGLCPEKRLRVLRVFLQLVAVSDTDCTPCFEKHLFCIFVILSDT